MAGAQDDGDKLLKRNRSTCLVAGALLASAAFCLPAAAAEMDWPEGPYRYVVIDQEVSEVLVEFGRNNQIPMRVSPKVEGRLRGRLPVVSAEEFLNRLCDSYGLVWYYDGSRLHVSTEAEMRTELIQLRNVPSEEFLSTLKELEIVDPRYTIQTTADTSVVSVFGPPPFIELVRRTRDTLVRAHSPRAREVTNGDVPTVRVFRGKS